MSKPSELGSLKIGSYILLPVDSPNAEPCKIVEFDTSKPGKHGAAIAGLPAVDTIKQVERTADGAITVGPVFRSPVASVWVVRTSSPSLSLCCAAIW